MRNFTAFIITLLFCSTAFASQPFTPVNPEGLRATFRAHVSGITPAATPTDVLTLCGSATKTVRITHIQGNGDANSASAMKMSVYKRLVDTGGTSALIPTVQYDSRDPTPTASARLYSANPSALGSGVLVAGDYIAIASTGSGSSIITEFFDFGTRNQRPLILRGTSECVAISLEGQSLPAGFVFYGGIEWTEE